MKILLCGTIDEIIASLEKAKAYIETNQEILIRDDGTILKLAYKSPLINIYKNEV